MCDEDYKPDPDRNFFDEGQPVTTKNTKEHED